MELYLIRHGQSANNANPGGERHPDPQLTEVGHQQAEQLAEWAKSAGLSRIISSPFLRALQTAEYVRQAADVPAEIWNDVFEQGGCCAGADPSLDLGAIDYQGVAGMTDAEIRQGYPHFQIPPEIDERGWWRERPFEPMQEAHTRAESVVERTRELFAHSDERVAIIFHGMFKNLILGAFFEKSIIDHLWLEVSYNTGISKLTLTPDGIKLAYYNSAAHLSESLLTF